MLKGHPTTALVAKQMTALRVRADRFETGSIAKLQPSMTKYIEKLDGRKAADWCKHTSCSPSHHLPVLALYMPALKSRKSRVYLAVLTPICLTMLR